MANTLNKITTKSILDATVATADIADDAVTADKLANAINTDIAAKAVLTGSTNNTITTVTGANAIQGEANLTYDGTTLKNQVAAENGTIAHFALSGNTHNPALLIKADESDQQITFRAGADISTYPSIAFDMGTVGDAVTIDSSGRLLVGTTTEGHADADDFTIASSGHTGLSIRSGTSNNGNIFFSDGTSGNAEIRGYIQYDHSNNRMYFGANATHEVSILDGGGISFNGDTAAANAIDDYEEGTWTPTIEGSSSKSVSSTVLAKYVKIGCLVHCQCYINLTGTGNSNVFLLGTLPFTNRSNGYGTNVADFEKGGRKGCYARVNTDATYAEFLYSSEDPANTRVTLKGQDVGTGYLITTIQYMTDS